jgi:hypothetical protein
MNLTRRREYDNRMIAQGRYFLDHLNVVLADRSGGCKD